MSPAELKASVRIQDTGTLKTLRENLVRRSNDHSRSDITVSSDQEMLHAIHEELQVRLLAGRRAVEFAQQSCRQAMFDSCESIIPMAAYIEVYEAAQQVRRIAASGECAVESP